MSTALHGNSDGGTMAISRAHLHHRKRRPHCTREEYSAAWNLLEVTPELHRWIHDNVGLSYARGWLVHSWDDPRDVPVTPHPELRVLP